MAKPKKDRSREPAPKAAPDAPSESPDASSTSAESKTSKKKGPKKDGFRETVESIAVAFILAFLFRTYEAEAFVIPTGSMAPTLYGRHKDVNCPQCGTHFTVGASDEVRFNNGMYPEDQYLNPHARLQTAFCPNCRYEVDIEDLRVFTGDRILVNKWPFEFGEPDRWDVVVFKYPEDPKTNYIKRLVGLPGEELRIERGNVFVRTDDGDWGILRKDDPNKQLELQIPVYDDRHPPTALLEAGWPERWGSVTSLDPAGIEWEDAPDGWQTDAEARSYSVDANGDEVAWLRYRHYLPSPADWEALPAPGQPDPQLITDFLAYNTYTGGAVQNQVELVDNRYWMGYWVGDLTVEGRVDVERAEGELLLELCHGFQHVRCTIDLATGEASLERREDGLDREAPVSTPLGTASTSLSRTGSHRFAFANVDQRAVLWIDGRVVKFDGDSTFGPPNLPGPHPRDLAPVGIGVRGGGVRVDQLVILRDIYYRAEKIEQLEQRGPHGEIRGNTDHEIDGQTAVRLARLRFDPTTWAQEYDESSETPSVSFERLGPDEFMMLGDNSARSQDSRLWPNGENPLLARERRHAVPRSALVGKAFFVYWPHGVPFLNNGKGYAGFAKHIPVLNRFFYHRTPPPTKIGPDGKLYQAGPPEVTDYPRITVPFYPQFGRMQRIR